MPACFFARTNASGARAHKFKPGKNQTHKIIVGSLRLTRPMCFTLRFFAYNKSAQQVNLKYLLHIHYECAVDIDI